MNEEAKEVEEMKVESEGEKPDQEQRLGELEQTLAQLQQRVATREEEVAVLKEQLSGSAQKYRALLLAAAPEVPEELVTGETPEEVEASFAAAREVVEKVRMQLEARAQAERVPAGAPPRGAPELGSLSPKEKIAYALATRQS